MALPWGALLKINHPYCIFFLIWQTYQWWLMFSNFGSWESWLNRFCSFFYLAVLSKMKRCPHLWFFESVELSFPECFRVWCNELWTAEKELFSHSKVFQMSRKSVSFFFLFLYKKTFSDKRNRLWQCLVLYDTIIHSVTSLALHAGVVELVDTRDLKSLVGNSVPVRVRSPAPLMEILKRDHINTYTYYWHF